MNQFSPKHDSNKADTFSKNNAESNSEQPQFDQCSTPQQILALQKTHGNAYVTRALQQKQHPKPAPTKGKGNVVRRAVSLLTAKDPAPTDTTPLKDWPTLQTAADSDNPTATDVHQILLTYSKLSDGWGSGMNEVAQAAANKHSNVKGTPESEISYGPKMALPGTEKRDEEMIEGTTAPVMPFIPFGAVKFNIGTTTEKSEKPLTPKEKTEVRKENFKKSIDKEEAREERRENLELERSESRAWTKKLKRAGGPVYRGTKMTATMLSRNGPGGSDATRGLYTNIYGNTVEGHLLNAYLHGSNQYENLAPFRSGLNGVHKNQVEEPLKKLIFSQGGMFSYVVTVIDGTDKTDGGFFPAGITCDVVEIESDKSPTPNGYAQHVTITQDGTVTPFGTNNTKDAPAKTDPMVFGLEPRFNSEMEEIDPPVEEMALSGLWNSLRFPWSPDYGYTVKQVLDAAYRIIRAYEAKNGKIGESNKLTLPATKVTYTTSTVTNAMEQPITVGQKMVAEPLSMRPPGDGGSKTSTDEGVEAFGFEPEESWGDGLVGGHLLNHHLHGPGVPANLAPMTNSLNQQFERDVESKLKTWVLSEGKVIRFEVEMMGEHPDSIGGYDGLPEKLEWDAKLYQPKTTGAPNLETADGWELSGEEQNGELYNNVGKGGATTSDEY